LDGVTHGNCLAQKCDDGNFYLMGECTRNYLPLNTSYIFLACQAGCPDCSTNFCHSCQPGYSGENGQCTEILCPNVENCDICESSTTCHTCDEQYYMLGDTKDSCTSNFLAINKLFTINKRLRRSYS